MGFLAGVVGELNRQEDKAERREEFMRNLLEKRKAAILPQILDRIEKRNEKAKTRVARINTATGFGMTAEAASVLESSGELDLVLTQLMDADEVDQGAVQRLSESVVANVKPEKVGAAMRYALDSGFASEPTSDKLVEAIFANTEEGFSEAINPLMSAASSSGPSAPDIKRLGVNPKALVVIPEPERAQIRKNLEASLAPQLGGSVDQDTGNINWTNGPAAGKIVENATRYYIEQISDPVAQRNPNAVQNDIIDSVYGLLQKYKLEEIADGFSDFPAVEFKAVKPVVEEAEETDLTATGALMENSGINTQVGSQEDPMESYLD